MNMTCNCKWQTTLAPYQKVVVDRINNACRDQFGLLLLHTMGSGKTIVALSIMQNYPELREISNLGTGKKGLIIAPAGIEDGFEYDPTWDCEMHNNDNVRPPKDLQQLFPYSKDAYSVRKTYDIMTIKYKNNQYDSFDETVEGKYKDSRGDAVRNSRPESLADKLANKIVIVDEAHNLIPFIRANNGSKADMIIEAFRGARRVILMTGTPIQRERSDITLLFNLIKKTDRFLPTANDVFDAKYYKFPPFYKNPIPSVLDIGKNILKSINDFYKGYGGTLVTAYAIKPATLALRNTLESSGWIVPSEEGYNVPIIEQNFFDTAVTLVLSNIYKNVENSSLNPITYMTEYLNRFDYRQLTPEFLDLASDLCSFFDYETAKPNPQGTDDELIEPRYFFPTKKITDIQVMLTKKQVQYIMAFQFKDENNRPIPLEQVWQELNVQQQEPTAKLDSYVNFGIIIGNISDDYDYKNKPILQSMKDPLSRHFTVKNATPNLYSCPKFDYAYTLLKTIHKQAYFKKFPVANKFSAVKNGLIKRNSEGIIERSATNIYLPVVWSNFESEGFAAFGAYLTARGHKYLVYLPTDTIEQRRELNEAAYKQYNRLDNDNPICILLHPSITEGISFTFSPALIALETIKGYGVQEQVYGRVLRRFNRPNEPAINNETRLPKYIYQLSSGYYTNYAINEYGELSEIATTSSRLKAVLQHIRQTLPMYATDYRIALNPNISSMKLNFADANPEFIQQMWNGKQEQIMNKIKNVLISNDDVSLSRKCLKISNHEKIASHSKCKVCYSGNCDCFETNNLRLCKDVQLGGGRRRRSKRRSKKHIKFSKKRK